MADKKFKAVTVDEFKKMTKEERKEYKKKQDEFLGISGNKY